MTRRWPSTTSVARMTIVAIVLASAGRPAAAQQVPPPRQMGFEALEFQIPDTARFEFTLENGLVGFAVREARAPIVKFSAFARAGTGDGNKRGVAEALVASMRRGPCWMGPNRFAEVMDRMAGQLSITMTANMTVVSLNVPAEDVSQGLRVFAGILRAPCIERSLLEDFAQNGVSSATPPTGASIEDGSMERAVELFNRRLFTGHRYSDEITAADAAAITVDDLQDYHQDFINPSNLVLAVSGDFDIVGMVREIDQRFADWERRRAPTLRSGSNIDMPSRATYEYSAGKLQTWIVMGHELPRVSPGDIPALQVMNYILGGGHFDTRLFRETRDKRGLTNDATGFLELNMRGPGTYTFRTYGRHEVARELVDIVFAEIERMQTELVSEEELFVAKGALSDGDFAMRFQDGHAVARTFAEELIKYGTFRHLFRYVRRVRSVSAEDVQRAARRYLHPERMTVVVLGR
ncbi:MAG: pitrilysin family protein [Gemmatimonadales bacterium]